MGDTDKLFAGKVLSARNVFKATGIAAMGHRGAESTEEGKMPALRNGDVPTESGYMPSPLQKLGRACLPQAS